MIRRPPRSTLDRSSAASDVYKRQVERAATTEGINYALGSVLNHVLLHQTIIGQEAITQLEMAGDFPDIVAVSYTHLRAHETVLDLVCRLLLEKKKNKT
mgnify:CR=1 FL=1